MNAAEQAKSIEFASKIASVVNLFKSEFPDVKADLKPWCNDPHTRELIDPDSIDIAFHFPGWSRRCQSRSMLVQIRFYGESSETLRRAIGVEVAGFTHTGEQWRLSTIDQWQFVGSSQPVFEVKDKLKRFCRHAVEVFNGEGA